MAADIPTLIVWGDHDGIIPSEHARAAQQTLPNSRLELFEGVGHFPHCEAPERFCRVLAEFMESTAPAALTEEQCAQMLQSA